MSLFKPQPRTKHEQYSTWMYDPDRSLSVRAVFSKEVSLGLTSAISVSTGMEPTVARALAAELIAAADAVDAAKEIAA